MNSASPFPHPGLRTTEVALESLKVGVRQSIGSYVAESLELTSGRDLILDRIKVQLTAKVLASQVVRDNHVYEIETPATWWQHLKHAHGPEWFKRRYPVRYEKTRLVADFKRYATYPKANLALPPDQFGYPVTLEMADSTITTSPWESHRVAEEPGPRQPVWVSREELTSRLWSTRAIADGGQWGPPPHPGHILAIIEALAELGVNPGELVRDA